MNKEIEIPFGSYDSELKGWEYTIPENMKAEIKDGKIIVKQKGSEDERIRKTLLRCCDDWEKGQFGCMAKEDVPAIRAYLEKQKEQKPAENIAQLTVQGKGVYKICPRCKERMVRDDSKVYTSMPPQYGYNCPKCGAIEFDTVMYDNPEMEEQKPAEWSEEDKNKLDLLHTCICRCISDPYWEYSKREKVLKEIIPFIEKIKSFRDNYKKCNSHWKPNEEQMWALDVALENFYHQSDRSALESLKTDLQKL